VDFAPGTRVVVLKSDPVGGDPGLAIRPVEDLLPDAHWHADDGV